MAGTHELKPWLADEVTEDFIAQIEELLAEEVSRDALAKALEVEGLSRETVEALLRDVTGLGHIYDENHAKYEGIAGIDARHIRLLLRSDADPQVLDTQAASRFAESLQQHGVRQSTAAAIVADFSNRHKEMTDGHQRRLRRLGLQGMVAGTIFTLFFGLIALSAAPAANAPATNLVVQIGRPAAPLLDARWHWLTVVLTAGLTGYSALLFSRNRL